MTMTGRFLGGITAVLIALGSAPGASADCMVAATDPSTIDGMFAAIPGFTVTPGCPAIGSPFAGTEMTAASAAAIDRDGDSVLTVFAGQLAIGSGADFIDNTFLAAVDGTAADTQTVGGYPVTYFNIPRLTDGYAYATGPTVVIAYDTASRQARDAVREVLPTLLGRVQPH
ncbi:MAG TPA: hypothetical protein PL146_13720, partial [Mycobacterium sp.]|nr:hypothetical protein [Mycobacterium sp.]